MRRGLFHIHTCHSFDCWVSPKSIVKKAIKEEIDYLVISDHDSLEGSIKAKEYAQQEDLSIEIPISAEYYTDIGDIVVVGVPEDFQKIVDHRVLCREAKAAGGYTILPHPYDHHKLEEIDFPLIDSIEVFNSRSSLRHNEKALDLAMKLNKPFLFGSDAHFLKDLTNCSFRFSGDHPFGYQIFPSRLSYTSQKRKDCSQLIKSWKQKDPLLFMRILKRMVF